jgi:dTDP-4-amino-4,6-dideoxygalactose transaminase
LQSRKIGYGIHYATPIHLMSAYSFLGYGPGDYPVSERLANEVLSLPCFPELAIDSVDRVCTEINEFYETERSEARFETTPQC